ncbi:MAG: chemotaxis protein CheW [Pseudomonadota bacterium]
MKDQPGKIKEFNSPTRTIDKTAILKQRAVSLAATQGKTEKEFESIEVLVFSLGSERYGVGSETVREVCPVKQITRVPCVPPFVMGIINVRGKIFSILDIRRLLNLPEVKSRNQEKVIIIGFEDMEVGILADDVLGVNHVKISEIQQDIPTLSGINEKYLYGIVSDRLTILNVENFLSDQSIIVDETV